MGTQSGRSRDAVGTQIGLGGGVYLNKPWEDGVPRVAWSLQLSRRPELSGLPCRLWAECGMVTSEWSCFRCTI